MYIGRKQGGGPEVAETSLFTKFRAESQRAIADLSSLGARMLVERRAKRKALNSSPDLRPQ